LDTSVVNIVLDELMRAAIDGGVYSQRCETICLAVVPLSSINVRGLILSKMRKVCMRYATQYYADRMQGFGQNLCQADQKSR
jgi:hypothetical protein